MSQLERKIDSPNLGVKGLNPALNDLNHHASFSTKHSLQEKVFLQWLGLQEIDRNCILGFLSFACRTSYSILTLLEAPSYKGESMKDNRVKNELELRIVMVGQCHCCILVVIYHFVQCLKSEGRWKGSHITVYQLLVQVQSEKWKAGNEANICYLLSADANPRFKTSSKSILDPASLHPT